MIRQVGKSDSLVILKKPFDNIEVLQLAHALTQKWTLKREVTCRLKSQTTRRMARAARRQLITEGTLVRVSELQGDVLLVEPAN